MSLFRRIFPGKRPPINENWMAGDFAENLGDGEWDVDGIGPQHGDVCRVSDVLPGRTASGRRWLLGLNGFPGYFNASAFRKVLPMNAPASAEFVAQIKSIKRPAKQGAPA